MDADDPSDRRFPIAQGRLQWQEFSDQSGEIDLAHLYSLHWYSKTDLNIASQRAHLTLAMTPYPPTSDKNFMSFSPTARI